MPELKPTRRFKGRVRLSAPIVPGNVAYGGPMSVLVVGEQRLRHVRLCAAIIRALSLWRLFLGEGPRKAALYARFRTEEQRDA